MSKSKKSKFINCDGHFADFFETGVNLDAKGKEARCL